MGACVWRLSSGGTGFGPLDVFVPNPTPPYGGVFGAGGRFAA
jgi:hypothetical protein